MAEPIIDPNPNPNPDLNPNPASVVAEPLINHPDPSPGTLPTHTPLPTPEEKQFTESIPEGYRDKAYLKGVKNVEEVYKKLDGAQELIGKKTIEIPSPEATDAEKEAFWSKIRPEKAEDYEFQIGDPEKSDKEFVSNVKGLFHKANLSKEQASVVQTGFDQIIKDIASKQGVNTKQQNANFDKLASDLFGADTDKVLAGVKPLLEKYTPESMKGHVKDLSNEQLIVLSSVINGIKKDFISEDDINDLGAGSGNVADIPALRKQAQGIMASEAFSSSFHQDHAKVQSDLKEIYNHIDRLQRLGKK